MVELDAMLSGRTLISINRRAAEWDHLGGLAWLVLIVQNPLRGAVEVFVLAGPDGPQERGQPQKAKRDGRRNEIHEHVQGTLRRVRALRVTKMEDDDIATAAIRGVTTPATAKGTNRAL